MSTSRASSPSSPVLADPLAHYVAAAGLNEATRFALQAWLGDQLVGDQYARLEQGGHTEIRTPLRKVFVDLPMSTTPSAEGDSAPSENFLSSLLRKKPARFSTMGDEQSDDDCESASEPRGPIQHIQTKRSAAGYLLIGGPGQGKSTLGQLACQLHRASLLRPRAAELPSEVLDVLRPFEGNDRDELPTPSATLAMGRKRRPTKAPTELVLPEAPLLPLRIVLPEAAPWLAAYSKRSDSAAPALLHFVADQPSARKHKVDVATLSSLAGAMPVLLVLDGFDEVGAPEDRETLVAAAQELFSALGMRGGVGLVVATTRPQGYAGELSRMGVRLQERHLALLTEEQAMLYAERLAVAQVAGTDEQHRFMESLRRAAREPATARLMRTPLQVTILAALVHFSGAPKERWKLFWSYFDFTLRREIARKSYASTLLKEHRAKIEALHMRVALLLQVEAETAGGAAARMTRERLHEVVDNILDEEGVGEVQREPLAREILDAAEKRLVFLVEPEPGRFGFEIRSLQEFLAAWALSTGREAAVTDRLLQVVRAPMFRNVVLFLTSRFFSENSPLRDVLADHICGALDEDRIDPVSCATRAGALLALEALEEGAVLNQPKRARALMERAVGLLDLPGGDEHKRLARVATADTEEVLRTDIELRLAQTAGKGVRARAAVWVCLAEGRNMAQTWANETAERWWETWLNSEQEGTIGPWLTSKHAADSWILSRIEANPARFPPETWLGRIWIGRTGGSPWLRYLARVFSSEPVPAGRIRTMNYYQLTGGVRLASVRRPPGSPPDSWSAWVLAADFILDPTPTRLAEALRCIATRESIGHWTSLAYRSPWPLACCLLIAETSSELHALADQMESGTLGGTTQWRDAESRWSVEDEGVLETAITLAEDGVPWNLEHLTSAPPLLVGWWWYHHLNSPLASNRIRIFRQMELSSKRFPHVRGNAIRERLASLCLFGMRRLPAGAEPNLGQVVEWVRAAPDDADCLFPRPECLSPASWLWVLERLQAHGVKFALSGRVHPHQTIIDWWAAPDHPLLLRMACRTLGPRTRTTAPDHIRSRSVALLKDISPTTPPVRADVATLLVYFGEVRVDQIPMILEEIQPEADHDPSVWLRLVRAAVHGYLPTPLRETLALAGWRGIGYDRPGSAAILAELRSLLAGRRSDLDRPAVWDRLLLPAPYPSRRVSVALTTGLPAEPVVLRELHLQDIRGLHDLRMELTTPPEGEGQWVVLIGPNGAGKTTILRSLVLALRDLENPAIWPDGVFEVPWTRVGGPKEARINVRLADGINRITTIHANGAKRPVQSPRMELPRLFPFFAYGVHRGSALGSGHKDNKFGDDGGLEVSTLFSTDGVVTQAESWLLIMLSDPKSKEILDTVLRALESLLDVEEVLCRDRAVWVREGEGRPEVPFRAMADGYLSTTGWFLDIVARWLELARQYNHKIEPDFLGRMTGLVLLDEIDLHLHPTWQRRVIRCTKELLKKMSFVVTTHNPLTLVGARTDEIWVLSRRDGCVRADRGVEAPITLTGGEIYSAYFGIDDVYPDELGQKLQRYGFLSGYALRSEEEQVELVELREALRAVGLALDWPEVPREVPPPRVKAKTRRAPKVSG